MADLRYLRSKFFLEYSYIALRDGFASKSAFTSFFNSIKDDEQKNLFLKMASFYLFLVKGGHWRINISGVRSKEIEYITTTYKYIAIFSLIEALYSQRYVDFYGYLNRRESNIAFPIRDKAELDCHYKKYKKDNGSIQKAVQFFELLSPKTKQALIQCSGISKFICPEGNSRPFQYPGHLKCVPSPCLGQGF